MQYIITFLEGVISFISPCMLPMLPIYISYFSGNVDKKDKAIVRAIAFVVGFTIIFCLLGVFAGTIGSFLNKYQQFVNIICGIIVIIFGLSYLEIIKLPFFKGINKKHNIKDIFSAFLFGIIFSINLTPCIGAFLGSALMMASVSETALQGMFLLLAYSLGLGIPFVISAILLEKLNNTFNFIKKHYSIINKICGIFLIIVGILIILGIMNKIIYLGV